MCNCRPCQVPDYSGMDKLALGSAHLHHMQRQYMMDHQDGDAYNCQVREIYGGNSGNSGRQVRTYEMSEGTSASAYVLRPFQTLVPRFRNGEIRDRRSKDRSKDRSWSQSRNLEDELSR